MDGRHTIRILSHVCPTARRPRPPRLPWLKTLTRFTARYRMRSYDHAPAVVPLPTFTSVAWSPLTLKRYRDVRTLIGEKITRVELHLTDDWLIWGYLSNSLISDQQHLWICIDVGIEHHQCVKLRQGMSVWHYTLPLCLLVCVCFYCVFVLFWFASHRSCAVVYHER